MTETISEADHEREPVAYAFELRGADYDVAWQECVDFEHLRNTYLSYGGFEVRNVRPLYADNDQEDD